MNTALYRLIVGFRRFKEKYFVHPDHPEHSLFSRLATGQTPKTLLIGCSDSRVDPAIMSGASPGELFVVRNVANLVPPCEPSTVGFHGTSSAIEFAVKNLKVENIIVLGHRQCGGIRALMSQDEAMKNSFVGQWMSIAQEVHVHVHASHPHADEDTRCRVAEMESIKVSIRNLKTFPFVTEAVDTGHLKLIGVYFDLEQGLLWAYDEATNTFNQLAL